MKTPFENDIFGTVWAAFKNLYPDAECKCYWVTEIKDENGEDAEGVTIFGDDDEVSVYVKASLKVADAAEILAHELAHVIAGVEAGHDEEWENAFNRIHKEYERIAQQCE